MLGGTIITYTLQDRFIMTTIIIFLLFLLNVNCSPNQLGDLATYNKGIGLIVSISPAVTIYSNENCTMPVDTFYRNINSSGKIFGGVLPQVTAYKNFEFGYEEYFLPVVETTKDNFTYKIIYQDSDGVYRHGYLSKNADDFEFKTWSEFLIDKPLFFTEKSNYKIYEYPDGPEIKLDESSFSNHIMWPEFERDGWIQVKLITPSDYCIQESECSKIINGAIKYMDSSGGLAVWFHTRGC